jgi:hypothetical protein
MENCLNKTSLTELEYFFELTHETKMHSLLNLGVGPLKNKPKFAFA